MCWIQIFIEATFKIFAEKALSLMFFMAIQFLVTEAGLCDQF